MDVRVTRTSDISQDVEVEIPAEEVEKAVDKQLKKLSKRVREPGFRKGKVPLKVVRRKFGQAARGDAISDLVNTYVTRALQEEGLEKTVHMSRPEVSDGIDQGPVTFTFVAENMPEVSASGYLGLEVEQEKTEVTDEDVEAQLEELQEEHTQLVPVEDRKEVEAGDVVTVDYQAQGEGPVSEIHQEGQEVDLSDEDLLEGFADGLIGATIDQAKTIEVTLPEDFSMDDLAGEPIKLDVTVRSIQKREIPAIDDDLAAESGRADSIDELRKQIREELEEERSKGAESGARRRLVDQIVEAHEFDVPPLYVESQAMRDVQQRLQMFSQQGLDPAQLGLDPMELVESSKPNIANSIREALVLQAIAKKEEISVDDATVESEIDKMAEERGIPRPRLAAQLKDPQAREQFRTQLLFDRVLDFVWSEARVELVDELTQPETNQESEHDATGDENDDA